MFAGKMVGASLDGSLRGVWFGGVVGFALVVYVCRGKRRECREAGCCRRPVGCFRRQGFIRCVRRACAWAVVELLGDSICPRRNPPRGAKISATPCPNRYRVAYSTPCYCRAFRAYPARNCRSTYAVVSKRGHRMLCRDTYVTFFGR